MTDYVWFDVLWKPKWNKDSCYKEAKKYKTRNEFRKAASGAYLKAIRMGWIVDYDWMTVKKKKPMGYWNDYSHCYEEAKKYKSRLSFQRNCMGGYLKALKNGWLDDYTWFKEKPKSNFWNRETCFEEAKKYTNKKEFKKHASGAYQLAYKQGWLNDYIWLKSLTGFWTYETCKTEASKYEKRSHFKKGAPGAYTKSRINGWLDEFFPKTGNEDN